jgi:hypothetical protein
LVHRICAQSFVSILDLRRNCLKMSTLRRRVTISGFQNTVTDPASLKIANTDDREVNTGISGYDGSERTLNLKAAV